MPLILTRKQSMWLGLGLLASFFIASGITIYFRNQARVPSQSAALYKEQIEGTPTAIADVSHTPAPSETPGHSVGFVLNDFHRSLVRDGKVVWEVHGRRGQYDPLSSRATIEKPDLNLVRKNGDTVKLTADKAELTLEGTQLSLAELHDNVVVVYKENTIVRTSQALYNEKEGRVDIPVPVELDSPMFALKGNKLQALLEPQEITITDGVTSVIKPRKK